MLTGKAQDVSALSIEQAAQYNVVKKFILRVVPRSLESSRHMLSLLACLIAGAVHRKQSLRKI